MFEVDQNEVMTKLANVNSMLTSWDMSNQLNPMKRDVSSFFSQGAQSNNDIELSSKLHTCYGKLLGLETEARAMHAKWKAVLSSVRSELQSCGVLGYYESGSNNNTEFHHQSQPAMNRQQHSYTSNNDSNSDSNGDLGGIFERVERVREELEEGQKKGFEEIVQNQNDQTQKIEDRITYLSELINNNVSNIDHSGDHDRDRDRDHNHNHNHNHSFEDRKVSRRHTVNTSSPHYKRELSSSESESSEYEGIDQFLSPRNATEMTKRKTKGKSTIKRTDSSNSIRSAGSRRSSVNFDDEEVKKIKKGSKKKDRIKSKSMHANINTTKIKKKTKKSVTAGENRMRSETMPTDIPMARSKYLKEVDKKMKRRITVVKKGTKASQAAEVANHSSILTSKRNQTPSPRGFLPAGNEHRRKSITSNDLIVMGDLFT